MEYGLVIDESMSGWISLDQDGNQHPFKISIRAFTKNILNYFSERRFEGTAFFPGFKDPTAISGTMQIWLSGVKYEINMDLEGVGPIQVKGQKDWVLSNLISSMTTLPLEVFQEGKKIGTAQVVYRDPLWKFPFGVTITSTESAFRPFLRLSRRLQSVAEIFVPHWQEIVSEEQLQTTVESKISMLPWTIRMSIRFGYLYLQVISLLNFGKTTSKISLGEKNTIGKKCEGVGLSHYILLPLSLVILSTTYGDKHYLRNKKQNVPTPPQNPEAEPWMQLNLTPQVEHSKEDIEVDVVIVGSGAGGAAAAYQLASQGHAVAVVEEGHYFKRKDMTGLTFEMMNKLYRDKGFTFTLSNAGIWLPTGKCVGGTTTINSGTCMRTPESVLDRWKNEHQINVDLEPYFPQVESMLDVKKTPVKYLGGIADVIERGTKPFGMVHEALSRNETGCDGESHCVLGCPTGAKRSTDVSYLPEAMKENAYLFSNYKVEKIIFEGKKAVGVEATLPGYGPEFRIKIRARKVILAGGTFGTAELLNRMGLRSELPELGKHLTVHPALNAGGLFQERVRSERFVPQSYSVYDPKEDGYILEGYTLNIDAIPHAFPIFGKNLAYIMDNYEYFTNFASMLKDPEKGRLMFLPGGKVVPRYVVGQKTSTLLKKSAESMAEVFFEAGAREVYLPIKYFETLRSKRDVDALKNGNVSGSHYHLSAHHPLGTCRMSASVKDGVVSENGEVWGMENLYVTDGSILPGPLGVNPQITIMANALRIADFIGSTL